MNYIVVTGMWMIFGLLCVYIFFHWRNGDLDKHTNIIRKAWYLIYILGSMIFLTGNPNSLLTNWKEYFIVLVAFIVVDSLVFLNLHFSKLGGQELQSTKVQVGITQEELDESRRKIGQIPNILISFEFPMYNGSNEDDIYFLEMLLKEYAAREALVVDLIPYHTEKEQEELLETLGSMKNRAKRFLGRGNSLASSKDQLALYPFQILGISYVVQLQTTYEKSKITEDDGVAITTLILAYSIGVFENKEESGDEE